MRKYLLSLVLCIISLGIYAEDGGKVYVINTRFYELQVSSPSQDVVRKEIDAVVTFYVDFRAGKITFGDVVLYFSDSDITNDDGSTLIKCVKEDGMSVCFLINEDKECVILRYYDVGTTSLGQLLSVKDITDRVYPR